jgi:hypothetical protein
LALVPYIPVTQGGRADQASRFVLQDVYAHLTPAMGERVAARMDAVLVKRHAVGA